MKRTFPERACAYCGITFIPTREKQRFHSVKCRNGAGNDLRVFVLRTEWNALHRALAEAKAALALRATKVKGAIK